MAVERIRAEDTEPTGKKLLFLDVFIGNNETASHCLKVKGVLSLKCCFRVNFQINEVCKIDM